MSNKKDTDKKVESDKKEYTNQTVPNEKMGFYFSSSLKIYDPNTKEIMIHKRAD